MDQLSQSDSEQQPVTPNGNTQTHTLKRSLPPATTTLISSHYSSYSSLLFDLPPPSAPPSTIFTFRSYLILLHSLYRSFSTFFDTVAPYSSSSSQLPPSLNRTVHLFLPESSCSWVYLFLSPAVTVPSSSSSSSSHPFLDSSTSTIPSCPFPFFFLCALEYLLCMLSSSYSSTSSILLLIPILGPSPPPPPPPPRMIVMSSLLLRQSINAGPILRV